MKKAVLTYALLSAFAITPTGVSPLFASSTTQDHDQDRDRDQNRDRGRDDDAYRNNRYYKQGWKDGEHHKQKDHKWKNDDDRRAYEAGYAHGDHGEKWQDSDREHGHY